AHEMSSSLAHFGTDHTSGEVSPQLPLNAVPNAPFSPTRSIAKGSPPIYWRQTATIPKANGHTQHPTFLPVRIVLLLYPSPSFFFPSTHFLYAGIARPLFKPAFLTDSLESYTVKLFELKDTDIMRLVTLNS
ncbi:hypothetical protein SK128_004173, partial [Halocaridina rubra]